MMGFKKTKTATGRISNAEFTRYHLRRMRADPANNAVCLVFEDDHGAEYFMVIDGDKETELLREAADHTRDCNISGNFNMPRDIPDVTVE